MFELLKNPVFFVATILGVAYFVSFIYLWFSKLRVWEYLQIHADGWLEKITHKRTEYLNEKFSCIFCLSFWMSMVICIVFAIINLDLSYLLIPPCTVPIVRRLG